VILTLPIREVLPATPRARIVRLDLGAQGFPYVAGQAVLIGQHGTDRRKPYSIAGSPEDAARDRCLELLVGVDADGSPGPHLTLEPQSLVDVDGPFGRFTFPARPEEDRFVFIAGGTGIAPLRAMLRHALNEPHRKIGVLYSARTPGEFAYEGELQTLARAGRIELRQTVTRDIAQTNWDGRRGRISRADLAPLIHDPATMCFVCGPPALVEEMPLVLDELGISRQRIRIEEWS
jgi:ferredoxin-NADP reductase